MFIYIHINHTVYLFRALSSLPSFIPQIAIAIGVLTSNRGESDEPFWQIGRGTRVPLQGGVDVVPLQGAIVVCHGWRGVRCHCSVLWLGRVTANFGGVDVVPLQGAIVNIGGVDVVPLQGAIVVCYGGGRGR